jgi:hypothetical protein
MNAVRDVGTTWSIQTRTETSQEGSSRSNLVSFKQTLLQAEFKATSPHRLKDK